MKGISRRINIKAQRKQRRMTPTFLKTNDNYNVTDQNKIYDQYKQSRKTNTGKDNTTLNHGRMHLINWQRHAFRWTGRKGRKQDASRAIRQHNGDYPSRSSNLTS